MLTPVSRADRSDFPTLFRCGLLLCVGLSSSLVCAQSSVQFPQTTAVGSSAQPLAISVTLPQGGSIGTIQILTQGSAGFDFANAGGGSCSTSVAYLANQQCTVSVGFTPQAPGSRLGAVVLLDSSGTTIGRQFVAASAIGPLAVFVPGRIDTIAGESAWIYNGDGMASDSSSIFLPFGVAVNAAGDLFIADSSNNRIRKVTAATGLMSTVAGSGLIGESGDGGLAVNATLSNPSSIVLDPAGNLYFSDSGNNVVRRIDAFTGIITTVAGVAGQHGYNGQGVLATTATLNTPNGLAFGPAGDLYLADSGNNVVRVVSAATGLISTVAGTGTAQYGGDGGLATAAQLSGPWGVTVSNTGLLYIADQNNNRIRMVDGSGIITTVIGTGVQGFSGDGGPAIAAELSVPASTVLDVAGNMYVADSGNNRVRKVNLTGTIDTIAGSEFQSYSGDTGPADAAGLYGPYTLTLDGQGSLLIADVFHNRIRKVWSDAAALVFAPIRVGRISTPLGQTLENDGNAPLAVASVQAGVNAQVDAGVTTCTASTVLSVLETCIIGVDFAPTTIGLQVFGSVGVASSASDSPGSILISGQVLAVDPASVSVASSLNPATVGQVITFLVTTNSAGTTPTGTVSLLDGSTVLAAAPLQSGTASFNLSTLTGGQHSITAAYSGDTSNSAAVSPVLLQTVNFIQAPTVTTLTANTNPLNAGAALTLTAGVTVAVPGSGSGAITGTVTFMEGSTVLGAATLNAAAASLTITTLAVGTHTIVATYGSNTSYSASTSVAVVERVQLATGRIALGTSANPSIADAPLTLLATLLSNGGIPTGIVAFLDGTTTLGTAVINNQGLANLLVPAAAWTVGTHTLTASYAGDAFDSGSVSLPVAQVVTIATTAVAIVSSLNPVGLGGQVIFTATVTGNGGVPSGTVQFVDGTTVLGTGTLSAAGVTTFTTAALTLGSHTVTAVYGGDKYDGGATSFALTQIVQQATTAVTLAGSANPANFGAALTLTANVGGSGSAPTGSVTFTDTTQNVALGTTTLGANGVATLTTSTLAIGTHAVVAQYGGDNNHSATASAALMERIVQATTTTLTASTGHSIAGTAINFTAAVNGAGGSPVTGNVTFSDGGATLGTTAIANGVALYSTTSLAPGSHNIAASYAGDTLDAASASSPLSEGVTIAASIVSLATSANPAIAGSALTLTSTVTGNGGTPTGSVTFLDGATVLSAVPLNAAGVATLITSTLTPGIHLLTASYSGDTDDQPAVSAALSQQVAEKTGVSLTSSANPSLLMDNLTITVTVGNGVAAPPTGSVTLSDGGVAIGTQQLGGAGSAAFTLTAPALGTHTLMATYAGDSDNIPATSGSLALTVVLRPSTSSLTPSTTALSNGQQLILFSIVAASGPRAATGQVTFASGSTVLGTATISPAGLATLTVEPAQGLYSVAAQYSGDSLYAASASAAISVTVGPPIEFTLSTPSTLSMQSGQHGVMQISVASNATFSDTLAFGCAGLPASATCTFSSDQMVISGGVAKTLSVTVDTGNPLGSGAVATNDVAHRADVLACALPLGALFALLLYRSRRQVRRVGLLTMLLAFGTLTMLSGCASSLSVKDTPAGSYTFQIVAAGNATGATGTANVALTVTK